jgi:hypothetical protein
MTHLFPTNVYAPAFYQPWIHPLLRTQRSCLRELHYLGTCITMNDLVDPLAGESIDHVFVLREKLPGQNLGPADIYAHEGALFRSPSGKHRIYERGDDGWCKLITVMTHQRVSKV